MKMEKKPQAQSSILDGVLEEAEREKASDVQITAGAKPAVKINGVFHFCDNFPVLTPYDTKEIILSLLTDKQKEILNKKMQVDFSFGGKLARYRANVYYQRGSLAMSIRRLKTEISSLEELHLPAYLSEYVQKKEGLILIAGPTGSGKSTTVASLLKVATERKVHILTIEDPVEYLIPHGESIVDQREVGTDVATFSEGMTAAVREAPDVIFIGEVRDPESANTVLSLASTGHLVITTIHAFPTIEAVNRMLSLISNKDWNRKVFAMNFIVVIAQRLIKTNGGALMPAVEILEHSHATEAIISEGRLNELNTYFAMGHNKSLIKSLKEMEYAGYIDSADRIISEL